MYSKKAKKAGESPTAEKGETYMDTVHHMYATDGVSAFYSGFSIRLIQQTVQKGLYFYLYTLSRQLYSKDVSLISIGENLGVGYVASLLDNVLTMPLDTISTKVQVITFVLAVIPFHSVSNSEKRDERQYYLYLFLLPLFKLAKKGTKLTDVVSEMYANQGLGGFFTGASASAILCINPAIQFACYESCKARVLEAYAAKSLTAVQAFFLGAFTKAIATVITYPFVRVKVLLQGNKDCEGKSMGEIFQDLYRMGLAEIFRGLWPQLTRGVLGAALMFFAKEKVEHFVLNFLGAEPAIKAATS